MLLHRIHNTEYLTSINIDCRVRILFHRTSDIIGNFLSRKRSFAGNNYRSAFHTIDDDFLVFCCEKKIIKKHQ